MPGRRSSIFLLIVLLLGGGPPEFFHQSYQFPTRVRGRAVVCVGVLHQSEQLHVHQASRIGHSLAPQQRQADDVQGYEHGPQRIRRERTRHEYNDSTRHIGTVWHTIKLSVMSDNALVPGQEDKYHGQAWTGGAVPDRLAYRDWISLLQERLDRRLTTQIKLLHDIRLSPFLHPLVTPMLHREVHVIPPVSTKQGENTGGNPLWRYPVGHPKSSCTDHTPECMDLGYHVEYFQHVGGHATQSDKGSWGSMMPWPLDQGQYTGQLQESGWYSGYRHKVPPWLRPTYGEGGVE